MSVGNVLVELFHLNKISITFQVAGTDYFSCIGYH